MSKYLDFVDATPYGRKTKIIEVRSKLHGYVLGEIRWYGRWRQYTFFPEPETTFNTDCMASISGTIMGLMSARATHSEAAHHGDVADGGNVPLGADCPGTPG